MAEHKLKIKNEYWEKVQNGTKTFEIRKNDRDYQVGDICHFVPISNNSNMILPHNPNSYRITYIFFGGEYGLDKEFCVFGIEPIKTTPIPKTFHGLETWICGYCGNELYSGQPYCDECGRKADWSVCD